ncbi:hypothetical protein [Streptomyces sp. NPDC007369]|uniref:hypothetical protein n=1 Tax=Streptomyces sp. NPDC007369 TaxID=3154589 RepID=UPI0033C2E7D2
MPVTINAHQLGRLIDRTIGHVADEYTEPLHGICLETDATHLYTVASDRYTIAAARYRHHGLDGEPFARTLPAGSLSSLREWITALPGTDPVTVNVTEDRFHFTAPHSTLSIAISLSLTVFNWRGVLRGAMEQTSPTDDAVFPVLDTRLLARFAAADGMIRLRVTADRQAVLIVGEDFLGAQMPARARRAGIGTDDLATLDQVYTTWHHTLADAEPIAMPDGIPAQTDRPRYEVTRDIAETAGDLLKQTLRSTHDMFSTDMPSEALAAYATAGVTAWTAYRYLDALHTADPKLAATVVAETADQLDSGEIGEFAWDAAQQAGHDPKTWSEEYEAWLEARAKNTTTQPSTKEPSTITSA